MVRSPSFDSNGMKKGAWSPQEDEILRDFVLRFGHANWQVLPMLAGLKRCGKSCRLRWVNYLKPGLKRGKFTKEEEDLVIKLSAQIGPKWSTMATQLPGRTDNEIKNYWHAHIKKRRQNKNTTKVIVETKTKDDQPSSAPKMINNSVPDQDKLFLGNVEEPAYYFPPLITNEHDQEQFYYDEYYPSSLDAGLRISPCHSAAAEFQGNNCFLSSGSEGYYQRLEEDDGFYVVLW